MNEYKIIKDIFDLRYISVSQTIVMESCHVMFSLPFVNDVLRFDKILSVVILKKVQFMWNIKIR